MEPPLLRIHHIFLMIIMTLCFIGANTQAHALTIDNVRVGTHPDKTRIVFDISNVTDFRTFTLADPYRLVVDLPSFDWHAPPLNNDAGMGVTGLRHGNLEAGISRIVFDLNKPISIQSAFVLPRQGEKPSRLVIDVSHVSHDVFMRSNGQSFGTLTLEPVNLANRNSGYSGRTASAGSAASLIPPYPTNKPRSGKKPLIVIDPGHGGVDPGAIGANGAFEKHVVLGLSKALKEELESTGRYRVILTRDTDVFIKLGNRVSFARQHDADLFLSVHADSLPRPNVSGASIYTLSNKASDAQTAKLAARENKADLIAGIDLSVEDEEVANILVNLAMRDTMNQSKYFANTLVDTFNTGGLKLLERPHRYAGFAVLKAPDIPSVLIEAGFMSNRSEADTLATDSHRRRFAKSVRTGIDAYFKTVAQNEQQ